MKAMIFAAGLGTRLRPITDNKPKALVEVGGVPMLRRVIENLKRYEIDEIVVNVHHFPDRIKEYLSVNDNFGVKLHISDESDKLLDTGGGILKAREWLDGDEPFLV
ncbi:sugar phosphate nucleotidyltransferase, partial [uncultured Muribaculum sp.]